MKTYKTHMLGPTTGSGWNRTLCEKFVATGPMADDVLVTADPDQVTCGHCRRRMEVPAC